jgi:hypothetical protein
MSVFSLETLYRLVSRDGGERMEVLERHAPRELVAGRDILRRDGLGRTVVACPKGTVPAQWLELSDVERASLVDPPPPVPNGTMHPGPYGFTPEGVVTGGWSFAEEL